MSRHNGAHLSRGGMTLEECAAELGVTRERVRQIEKKALRKLQLALRDEGLSYDALIGDTREAHSLIDMGSDDEG